MGTLQIDTISVVARSPYLVLFSRLGAYEPKWLDELLAEGALFEYWSHEACFLPIEDYALYRHRMDEEQSFRDDKSSGFEWDASRVRDPTHMARLLLVLQLAACFVLAQGVFVLQHGYRHVLERTDRTTLSLFALGLRWLDRARLHFVSLSPRLSLPFT